MLSVVGLEVHRARACEVTLGTVWSMARDLLNAIHNTQPHPTPRKHSKHPDIIRISPGSAREPQGVSGSVRESQSSTINQRLFGRRPQRSGRHSVSKPSRQILPDFRVYYALSPRF